MLYFTDSREKEAPVEKNVWASPKKQKKAIASVNGLFKALF